MLLELFSFAVSVNRNIVTLLFYGVPIMEFAPNNIHFWIQLGG